jgi:hypothetical protein
MTPSGRNWATRVEIPAPSMTPTNLRNILVGLRHLLGNRSHAGGLEHDPSAGEIVHHVAGR